VLLRYELGPNGLDSEFDFPLLWALRGALADGSTTFTDLEASIAASQSAWAGSGAVMGKTIGNHDVARFASVSAGDGGGDGWTPAAQSTDPIVYAKQTMALGVVLTLPGAPVVYYGDEVALAGHVDPDSRRVLPGEADLSPLQKRTRDAVKALGSARACSSALRRGAYRTLAVDAEHLVFAREGDAGDVAIVSLQRDVHAAFSVSLPGIAAGDWVDVLTGRTASLRPELTILDAQPFSLQLFFPKGSPCVHP
jgi:glycosidase